MNLDDPAIGQRLRGAAEQVAVELECQQDQWSRGFTRRRMIQGVGLAGVAAFASQLVTTKVSFASSAAAADNTLIVVFLRGGADGLSMLVPKGSELGGNYLATVRQRLVPADGDLIPVTNAPGWGLNKGFGALQPFLASDELAFIPAVSASGVTRSHFQAQQQLERGGTSATGWIDRTLQVLGPGTTFRATAIGWSSPSSMSGNQQKMSMDSLANFKFPGWDGVGPASRAALSTLYRGDASVLGADVPITLAALDEAERASSQAGTVVYPEGDFGASMKDLATLLRAEVGLQVATVDVGGWDTHTNEVDDIQGLIDGVSKSLAAFMTDLGPTRRNRVTVAVMTEFGRRVELNASNGTDHGTGSLMFLLGGGLKRSGVYGSWQPLSGSMLVDGDVPRLNAAYDVLYELVKWRLHAVGVSTIFPGHQYREIGFATH